VKLFRYVVALALLGVAIYFAVRVADPGANSATSRKLVSVTLPVSPSLAATLVTNPHPVVTGNTYITVQTGGTSGLGQAESAIAAAAALVGAVAQLSAGRRPSQGTAQPVAATAGND
jgi:hypothetical protein